MVLWKRYANCGWLVAARSKLAPRPRTSSTASPTPHPTSCAPSSADSARCNEPGSARLRPGDLLTPSGAAKRALRSVATRYLTLHDEIRELDGAIRHVLDTIAAPILERFGFGYDTTGTLLCAAGDNPERINTEAGFAALCGSNPIRVSSGKTNRHRLNRAGDRHANAALWTVVMTRIAAKHPPTINYIERRTTEGLSKREAIRCLKRYVAREIHNDIRNIILTHKHSRIAA